jgi:hypothetical protein
MAGASQKTKKAVVTRRPAQLLYLYAISKPIRKTPAGLRGVDGVAAVEPVLCAGFTCWVSRVDAHEFGTALSRKMEDLEWLANASVNHQRVVGRLAEHTEVLPARFATVFHNEHSLLTDIKKRGVILGKQLQHIHDAEEWGIKVFRKPQPTAPVSAASGRDYLQQKASLLKRDTERKLDPAIVAFARELHELARDSAAAGKVSSAQAGLEWQASFLVPRTKRKQWDKVLRRYATDWHGQREIEATGPWPPYSFVN